MYFGTIFLARPFGNEMFLVDMYAKSPSLKGTGLRFQLPSLICLTRASSIELWAVITACFISWAKTRTPGYCIISTKCSVTRNGGPWTEHFCQGVMGNGVSDLPVHDEYGNFSLLRGQYQPIYSSWTLYEHFANWTLGVTRNMLWTLGRNYTVLSFRGIVPNHSTRHSASIEKEGCVPSCFWSCTIDRKLDSW